MDKDFFKDKSMVVYMTIFAGVFEVIGVLLVNDKMAYTVGIIFGLLFSILKLKLMKDTISKAVNMPQEKAQRYSNIHYGIRYVLSGIVLAIAAIAPYISVLGVFIGMESMKAAAYMQIHIDKKQEKAAKSEEASS